ncbi:hypothetical protein GCM10027592_42590 [Spirosoma flavus]
MMQLFQERDFGTKINATFQYISQNFRSYILCILYIVGPLILLGILGISFIFSKAAGVGSSRLNSNPTWILNSLPLLFVIGLAFVLGLLAVALVTFAHMKVYSQNPTSDVQVSQVWDEVRPSIGTAIIFAILSTIVINVASLLFVLPGIYIAVVTSLGLPIIVFEQASFGQVWSRCFQLITDKWWSTFGLIVVMYIIGLILYFAVYIPGAFFGLLIAAFLKSVSAIFVAGIVSGLIVLFLFLLILGLYYTAIGFQYTNLVERQEGRGLISVIDSIGTSPAQPRATDEGDY